MKASELHEIMQLLQNHRGSAYAPLNFYKIIEVVHTLLSTITESGEVRKSIWKLGKSFLRRFNVALRA